MRNLLSADLSRLWKDKAFWLCVGGSALCAVVYMLFAGQKTFSYATGEAYALEDHYFRFMIYAGFVFAVFISLFLGTERNEGTLRNKLIAGHTRTKVYLASGIVTFLAALLFLCAWCLGALAGVPAFGFFTPRPAELAGYFLLCISVTAAYCALDTFIAMLAPNKTAALLLSVGLSACMLLCAGLLNNALEAPETIGSLAGVSISGAAAPAGETVANPGYVGGALRQVFQILLNVLPAGQGVRIAFLSVESCAVMLLCSAAVTAGVAALGTALFRRKDLK